LAGNRQIGPNDQRKSTVLNDSRFLVLAAVGVAENEILANFC
jgi:hypothetical protein